MSYAVPNLTLSFSHPLPGSRRRLWHFQPLEPMKLIIETSPGLLQAVEHAKQEVIQEGLVRIVELREETDQQIMRGGFVPMDEQASAAEAP